MKYLDYDAGDFAKDSFFIRWVRRPDAESDWFWNSFIKENPACAGEIERARQLVASFDFPHDLLDETDVARMRNGLLLSLRAEKEERREKLSAQRFLGSQRSDLWLKIAAAIILIPFVSFGLYFLLAGGRDAVLLIAAKDQSVEQRINPSGQKSVLFLSDGTRVWLNAASELSYAKNFHGKDTRDVYLEGEAFFDVAEDGGKPFIVHTSSIHIKVLGTSFNVKSYSDERTIETTLVEGKVRIGGSALQGRKTGEIELKPNQKAVFDKESKVIKIREVTAVNSGSWKLDKLIFDEEPIDNVLLQLERWYDVKIHVEDRGQLDCKLTATIEKESLEEVLKLIEASHDVTYTLMRGEVYLEGRLCR